MSEGLNALALFDPHDSILCDPVFKRRYFSASFLSENVYTPATVKDQDGFSYLAGISAAYPDLFAFEGDVTIVERRDPLVIARDKDTIYLTLQGTADMADLIQDVKFAQEPMKKGAAHMGFHQKASSVSMEKYVYPLLEEAKKNGKKLVITGHSLGGAGAVVLTAMLLLEKPEWAEHVHCITFGAPFSITEETVTALEPHKNIFHNFFNPKDYIPTITLSILDGLWQYVPIGRFYYVYAPLVEDERESKRFENGKWTVIKNKVIEVDSKSKAFDSSKVQQSYADLLDGKYPGVAFCAMDAFKYFRAASTLQACKNFIAALRSPTENVLWPHNSHHYWSVLHYFTGQKLRPTTPKMLSFNIAKEEQEAKEVTKPISTGGGSGGGWLSGLALAGAVLLAVVLARK